MNRILASITTLAQHIDALDTNSSVYRPLCCGHCGLAKLWSHGCYFRKTDRNSLNSDKPVWPAKSDRPESVPILRYLCPGCKHTCSRLPACIAPRRWYDWVTQALVLLMLLTGSSTRQCSACTPAARSTVRRWRQWLEQRGQELSFWLCSRFPDLGRHPDQPSLWCDVMRHMTLMQAMACCDCHTDIP